MGVGGGVGREEKWITLRSMQRNYGLWVDYHFLQCPGTRLTLVTVRKWVTPKWLARRGINLATWFQGLSWRVKRRVHTAKMLKAYLCITEAMEVWTDWSIVAGWAVPGTDQRAQVEAMPLSPLDPGFHATLLNSSNQGILFQEPGTTKKIGQLLGGGGERLWRKKPYIWKKNFHKKHRW